MKVVNYTEIAVKNIIDELFQLYQDSSSYCDCDICRSRALAAALNELPPCYVASDAEFMAVKTKFQNPGNNAALVAAVMNAIKKVISNPRHDLPPLTLDKLYN